MCNAITMTDIRPIAMDATMGFQNPTVNAPANRASASDQASQTDTAARADASLPSTSDSRTASHVFSAENTNRAWTSAQTATTRTGESGWSSIHVDEAADGDKISMPSVAPRMIVGEPQPIDKDDFNAIRSTIKRGAVLVGLAFSGDLIRTLRLVAKYEKTVNDYNASEKQFKETLRTAGDAAARAAAISEFDDAVAECTAQMEKIACDMPGQKKTGITALVLKTIASYAMGYGMGGIAGKLLAGVARFLGGIVALIALPFVLGGTIVSWLVAESKVNGKITEARATADASKRTFNALVFDTLRKFDVEKRKLDLMR